MYVICNSYANNNKKTFMTLKQRHLLTHTVLRHGNIPAEDNEEIRSLPLSGAFQMTT